MKKEKTEVRLAFDVKEIAALVAITRATDNHRALFGRQVEPGLFFVKDEGIYLMPSAAGMEINPETGTLPVSYAKGFNPKVGRQYVWEKAHDISGDDFSEFVPLEAVEPLLDSCSEIYVVLTEKMLAVEGKPKRRVA